MKKLIVVLALVASAATVSLAVDKEKVVARHAKKQQKEMKCCDKEITKECKKESKACCEKKAEQ